MSLRVLLFPRANADLKKQYAWYLKHAGAEVAERYFAAFDETIATLALHSGLGPLGSFRNARLAGIRSYPFKKPFDKHLIFHRTDSTTLTIVRVMHGARNLPRRLLE